ncbi:hypothetical protein JK361_25205 [Streptomyces sp. 5-8]|uniref:Uncharacterized protein n=1 Tax=Streptomyces musisoli TaxID=2802280 RepID=A0ABS1P6H2_9ACTN|nr:MULTISPECIES: hypothetical protein [Streptomyces]MBL1107849.1 hypothetical protein [Streptomyces musisoli]MBY8843110.1 hypothetical protein [Streptomyces sp. SP2-10]
MKQTEQLNTLIEGFRRHLSSRASLRAELAQEGDYHIVRIDSVPNYERILDEVSLGVGDIVNNLRCSLDHLAWQYACAHAQGIPSKPKNVYFIPCHAAAGQQHKKPGTFAAAAWDRMHEYQPCRGINGRPDGWTGPYIHQLDLLTELSNSDKHQMLVHVELQATQFETIPTRHGLPPWIRRNESGELDFLPDRVGDPDPGAERLNFSHSSHRMEAGEEVVRIHAPLWGHQPEIENAGSAVPHFSLPEGRPVMPTLQRISKFVAVLTDDLQRNCP